MVEVQEEDRERVLGVATSALPRVSQPFDKARPIWEAGESVVERVVPQLALYAFGFDGASLQLDLGNRGGGDLGEVLDLARSPLARRRIDGDDEGEGLARGAGDKRAEESGDT